MHGYGMGPGSEWSMKNWPRSPGELIHATIEIAGEPTGNTVELNTDCPKAIYTYPNRPRKSSRMAIGPRTSQARVASELAGELTGNTVVLAG
ncbi:hypothetical protein F2Q69_00058539 [Brassica cretica]|uniref:Uncharacterized protein n=1 Tax=Brassica cretica TaxID=69181 RepID=A0A8S9RNX8_BRACR|nr:hypothetical protein F2Q69_00058539 [Brassica cretica]